MYHAGYTAKEDENRLMNEHQGTSNTPGAPFSFVICHFKNALIIYDMF
jgi:hypothetical protein